MGRARDERANLEEKHLDGPVCLFCYYCYLVGWVCYLTTYLPPYPLPAVGGSSQLLYYRIYRIATPGRHEREVYHPVTWFRFDQESRSQSDRCGVPSTQNALQRRPRLRPPTHRCQTKRATATAAAAAARQVSFILCRHARYSM